MTTFGQDEKWVEAKRAVGDLNWLEVVSYYRSIDGKNVFVYSIIEGDKRLIVDVLNDDSVLLINKHGEPVIDSYDNVMNSRKTFKYSDDSEVVECHIGKTNYKVTIESHN